MTVRNEITALIDELPESSLRIAKSLLLQSKADDRFRRETFRRGRNRTPVGRVAWSGVQNGFHVAGHTRHRVQNNKLIVQTLYSYDGHEVDITEKFSLAARNTKLLCRLVVSSGGVTFHHDDQFPLLVQPSKGETGSQ